MFKIGQKVVCIDDSINPETAPYMPLRPKLNEVYTVESIHQEPNIPGYGIRLVELPNPSIPWSDGDEQEWSLDAHKFRPVVQTENVAELGACK